MKRETEYVIASLAATVKPVKPAAFSLRTLLLWYLCAAVYVVAAVGFLGMRPDIMLKMHDVLYSWEIVLLALIFASAAASCRVLSFPDLYQKRLWVYLPLLPLALFVLLLGIAWMRDSPPSPEPLHGMECLRCILMFSLLPCGVLFLLISKQATTHYLLCGAVAALAASSLGCIALRLSEQTDSIAHVVKWHYMPIAVFCAIGMMCARRMLKW